MLPRISVLLIAIVFASCATNDRAERFSPESSNARLQTVREYTDAFNKRDLESMLARVSNNIQWLSINGEQLSVVTTGKDELATAMKSYFEQCSSCRSRLENVSAFENRVSATEIASWESGGQIRSQGAMSVYEFSEGLIQRVYYFSEE